MSLWQFVVITAVSGFFFFTLLSSLLFSANISIAPDPKAVTRDVISLELEIK